MISWKTAALAALTCTAASVTSAQQVTLVAKTNPFGLFASQYQLGYEHGLNDNFSVLSAGFMGGTGGKRFEQALSLNMVSTQRTGFIAVPECAGTRRLSLRRILLGAGRPLPHQSNFG